jgi:hypothetical protein
MMELFKSYPAYPNDQTKPVFSFIHASQGEIWNKNIEEFTGTCRSPSDRRLGLSPRDIADRKPSTKKTSFMISDILCTENKDVENDNHSPYSDPAPRTDYDKDMRSPLSESCPSPGI